MKICAGIRNYTAPWWLMFPGYNEPDSPFRDKRVRQAVSLALNRQFLVEAGDAGHRHPVGQLAQRRRAATRCAATARSCRCPNTTRRRPSSCWPRQAFRTASTSSGTCRSCPISTWPSGSLTDLRAVGIRGKLEVLEGPAFRAKIGQGRKGYPGQPTIVQNIDPRPGGAAANIGVYAVCGGSASFVCEPQIESLWKTAPGEPRP